MSVVHHGSIFGVMNAENTDFGLVDDGCRTQPSQSTEAGDGEGGAGQLCAGGFAVAGRGDDFAHLAGGVPNVERLDVGHDGDVEAAFRLRGDAEVHGLVTDHGQAVVFVVGVADRVLAEGLGAGDAVPAVKDLEALRPLRLRFFAPAEIARLHGFGANELAFPPETSRKKQYELLGNSLSVTVVTHLLRYLVGGSPAPRAALADADTRTEAAAEEAEPG